MPYAAAIFDLDGTLIDSVRDIGEAMNRTLETLGYPTHPIEAYNIFVGDGVKQLVERTLPAHARTSEIVEQFISMYREDYLANWTNNTRVYPGIRELLLRLVDAYIPIGVLSNKPDNATRKCVEHFFPDIPFIAVAGQKDDVPRKPDPSVALAIAEAMNRQPGDCVFIGDTSTDMKTAVAGGMFPAGVLWGFRGERELIESGARLIAATPEALAGLFFAGR